MFHYVYITIFILKADHCDAKNFFPVKTNYPPIVDVEPSSSNFYHCREKCKISDLVMMIEIFCEQECRLAVCNVFSMAFLVSY